MGRGEGGQKAPDRHPGPDGQTDKHTHTRQNLYILAMQAVISVCSMSSVMQAHRSERVVDAMYVLNLISSQYRDERLAMPSVTLVQD